MTQAAGTVVRKKLVVEAPTERAFNVFTSSESRSFSPLAAQAELA